MGPSSTIQTGRSGSASPCSWLRVLKESTVTARFGISFVPVFLTEIVIGTCLARLCDFGKFAFTTFIGNVPDGSFLSWRSPPPHPATTSATIDVASTALGPLLPVTARGTYQSIEAPRAGCGHRRLPFGSARDPPVVFFAGQGRGALPKFSLRRGLDRWFAASPIERFFRRRTCSKRSGT